MGLTTPWLLLLGLAAVAAVVAGATLTARQRASTLAGAGIAGQPGRAGLAGGQWLSVAGLTVLAVAIAGPTADVPTPRSAGTLILVIDVSQSMTATDVEPTRLDAAKQAASALIEAQPDSADIGVVAFQSGALSAGQPSPDHLAAEAAVDRLTPAGGTSLTEAILGGLSAITGTTVTLPDDGAAAPDLGYWSSATIVLFSDGEEPGDSDTTAAASALAQSAGVHIETIGVGTTDGDVVDADGYQVHTALDEEKLTEIAETTGGDYHPSSAVAEVADVADSIDQRLTVEKRPLSLAGPLGGLAALLLAVGSGWTLVRTGRLV